MHHYNAQSLATVLIATCFLTGAVTEGALVDLTSTFTSRDAKILFVDDFNDNSSGWSNVGVVNGVGTGGPGIAEIGLDPLGSGESAWFPSDISDGAAISSVVNLPIFSAPDIMAMGEFSVYMRVRIETDHINARFSSRLTEQANGANFNAFEPRPATGTFLNYRQTDGGQANYSVAGNVITVADGFVNFRFTFTDLGNGAMTLDGYYYNKASETWVLAISSVQEPDPARYSTAGLGAGIFDAFQIASRKGTAGGYRAVFDAVAITTIPEPASAGLLALAGLAALRRRRG